MTEQNPLPTKKLTCTKCGAKLRANNLGPHCSPCSDGLKREENMLRGLGLPSREGDPTKKVD